jgi:hypothetical protein
MAPSNRTAPIIRKNKKVSGCAYGRPSFAPINPDAHKMTNSPGAATIVKCSIGVTAESELSEAILMECVWNPHGKVNTSRKEALAAGKGFSPFRRPHQQEARTHQPRHGRKGGAGLGVVSLLLRSLQNSRSPP